MKYRFLLLALVFPLIVKTQVNTPSGVLVTQTADGYQTEGVDSGAQVVSVLRNDSIIQTTFGSNEDRMADVIIELNDEPLMKSVFRARKKFGRHNHAKVNPVIHQSKVLLDNTHKKFKTELRRINDEDASQRKSAVRREYLRAFNGIAVHARFAHIERLKKMPIVKKIYFDYQVKASLTESVAKIHVDDVQALGYTGEGCVVGIIDAGIDYNHPALGGGFGPQFKIIGGYDFVNDDTDPMDDNSHGTHVAGIIAADGEVRGVSPGVKLVAYKVLNSSGNGSMSDVVAAVEKSCDPDGDPLTDDALDVINLSLGGPGNSSDPLCQAIENATDAGVVCVVASGNRSVFQSIESPGCAASAITVGATDDFNQIAYFSSKGPTCDLFAIKPDVVAPGVSIRSTLPGGAYGEQNGTSMAAPHVAGLAALLLQLHPDWSPEMIKQCIMLSSDSCNANLFSQGSGLVNALKAVNQKTLVSPASISLGIDTVVSGLSVTSSVLKVQNRDNYPISYTLTASIFGQQPGISLSLSPDVLVVQPGDSSIVVFTMTIDNSIVPEIPNAPYSYMGNIVINGAEESLRVPYAILKADVISVHFSDYPTLMIIHDRAGKQINLTSFDSTTNIVVPHGMYDIMACYAAPGAYIVRENIASGSAIEMRLSDTIHSADITTIDSKGNVLQCEYGMSKLINKTSGISIMTTGSFRNRYSFSSVSPAYAWEWSCFKYDHDTIHQFLGMSAGFSADTVYVNQPSDLRKYTYHFNPPSLINNLRVSFGTSSSPFGNWYYSLTRTPDNQPLVLPNTQIAYYMPSPSEEFSLGFTSRSVYECGAGSQRLLCQSPFLSIDRDGSAAAYLPGSHGVPKYSIDGNTIEVGIGPMYWMGQFVNSANLLRIIPFHGYQQFGFSNQTCDLVPQRGTRYTLYQNGSLVKTDTFSCNGANIIPPVYITPGTYSFVSQFDSFFVGDIPGNVKVSATFNTLLNDKNPPTIKDFRIESLGKPTVFIRQNQPSMISFELWDSLDAATATAFYRSDSDTTWMPLPLVAEGMRYTVTLPFLKVNNYLSFKIIALDPSGNELICEIDPVCKVLVLNDPPILEATGNRSIEENELLQFTLHALDPDSDPLSLRASGLPQGASFNPATASFIWRPDYSQSGSYPGIVFTVSDGEFIVAETLTVTVSNINRPPVVINDQITISEDQPITFSVLSNGSDADDDPLTVDSILHPSFGTVTINGDNTITYVPKLNYSGLDQFKYSISDGQGGTAWATVFITIAAVNDPPVVEIISPVEDVFSQNKNLKIKAMAFDVDGIVSTVAFYCNGVLLYMDTSNPYTYKWENAEPGNYALICKAYDRNGGVGSSSTVNIQIK